MNQKSVSVSSCGCRFPRRTHRAAALLLLALGGASCRDSNPAVLVPEGGLPGREASLGQSITFTTEDEFLKGKLDGLSFSDGTLNMETGTRILETPYMWIPNSAEGESSVAKVDTKTRVLLSTYSLGNCEYPSRTTVDIDGNIWVGCRGRNSYRNGTAGARIPYDVDNRVIKMSRDGKILLTVTVGNGPRALALDKKNHLWVGCSVDDTVWEIDAATGQCLRGSASGCGKPAIKVPDFPYGAVVDQRQHLWVINRELDTSVAPDANGNIPTGPGQLTEVDTETGKVVSYPKYARNCPQGNQLYGIAVDQLNDIWIGGFSCNDVVKVKGVAGIYPVNGKRYAAGEMIGYYTTGGTSSRGVALDLDDNVWVAMSGTSTAVKINGATGKIMDTVNVGKVPIGVGVDIWGNAWIVSEGAKVTDQDGNSVTWINGLDTKTTQVVPGLKLPYSYSDMLGLVLHLITHNDTSAYWSVVIDSKIENPVWKELSWGAKLPFGSKITASTRCADSEQALAQASFGSAATRSPSVITSCTGRYLEVQMQFRKLPSGGGPSLEWVTATWE